MSLWRVKHTLSPVVEAALIAVVASYGFLAMYIDSLRPLAVPTLSPISAIMADVSLDTDDWSRHDVRAARFAFALPPGWFIDETDPAVVRIARSKLELPAGPGAGTSLWLQTVPLPERQEIANLLTEEYRGERPAVYEVSVDGRSALFAVAFDGGRVRRQTVYVPNGAGGALVIRGGLVDPAVFATLVSTIRFYDNPNPTS